jgi:hypothetical protein
MVAWRRDFGAVFGVMQDHDVIPHNVIQCNHGALSHNIMQKRLDYEMFTDPVYFVLKFLKRSIIAIFTEICACYIRRR